MTLSIGVLGPLVIENNDCRLGNVPKKARLVALDPLSEFGQRALIRAFARAGRPSEALRQYKSCAETLERELGVAPDAETQTLAETILRSNRAGKERSYHLISRINDFPLRAIPNNDYPV